MTQDPTFEQASDSDSQDEFLVLTRRKSSEAFEQLTSKVSRFFQKSIYQNGGEIKFVDKDEVEYQDAIKPRKYILMDNTAFKYYWNLFIIVFAIYNMVSIPMTLFFEEADYEENGGLNEHERMWNYLFWLNVVADLIFYIDMAFGFLTAYFH